MKTNSITTSIVLATSLIAAMSGRAQGTFQNLDFESANIPNGTQPSSPLPASMALPGWSVNVGSVPYDAFSLGGTVISIFDTNADFGFVPLQGRYSAALFGGRSTATITQTGLVPVGTKTLQFAAYAAGDPFLVMVGGQTINMVPLSQVPRTGFPTSYTVYGGDISSFAGLTEELSISALVPAQSPPSELFLDNIVFSPNVIPEPGTLALFCASGLLFGLNRRRAK